MQRRPLSRHCPNTSISYVIIGAPTVQYRSARRQKLNPIPVHRHPIATASVPIHTLTHIYSHSHMLTVSII